MKNKNLLTVWIAPIAVALFTVFLGFYLNRSVVDLKYTLSDRIVVNHQGESVQQLEIRNLGNAPAEKIIIDLVGNIKTYSLTKNAESDTVEKFSKPSGFQIIYPELPPQSSIRIAVTTTDSVGIQATISHNKGIAKEALASSSTNELSLVFLVLYAFLFGFYIWINIKNVFITIWSKKAISDNSARKLLTRTTPPAFLKKEWSELKELAIQQEIKTITNDALSTLYPIEAKGSYKFLQGALFSELNLSDKEKNDLIVIAKGCLELSICNKRDEIYRFSDFNELMLCKKPELFSSDRWDSLRKSVVDYYLKKIKQLEENSVCIERLNESELIKISLEKLDFLNDSEREEFKKSLKNSFVGIIKNKINNISSYSKNDIVAFCQTPKPIFLLQHEWDDIIAMAKIKFANLMMLEISRWNVGKEGCESMFSLNIPNNLKGSEWNDFQRALRKYYSILAFDRFLENFSCDEIALEFQAENIDQWDSLQKIFKEMEISSYIKKAIVATPDKLQNTTKPEQLDKKVSDAIESYVNKKSMIDEELQAAADEHCKFETLKQKVLNQLDFIQNILEKPMSIERIEDYEDVFSKANYANLKTVCELLKTSL